MAAFFYAIGILVSAVGGLWCFAVLRQPRFSDSGMEALGTFLAMTPGVAVIGSGLLFIAIGAVLHRLDKIVVNTAVGHEPPGGAYAQPREPRF